MVCFEVYKPDLKVLQLSGSYNCDSLQMSNPQNVVTFIILMALYL